MGPGDRPTDRFALPSGCLSGAPERSPVPKTNEGSFALRESDCGPSHERRYVSRSSAAAIRAQIAELNAKVVAYCVPIVTSNVKQYLHYRKDVSTLPEPMAYGLATSQAGSRSLEMKPFV